VVGKVWLEIDREMNLLTMEFEDGRESWQQWLGFGRLPGHPG